MQPLRLVEMRVEGGRDAAHQEARILRQHQRRAVELDNAVGNEIAQARGRLQHFVRSRTVPRADRSEIDGKIAHDAFDNLRAQAIVALAVAAALLLHMLVATWFAHARAERRGLITAAAALVLYTGWLLFVDVFAGWRSHRWVKVIPEMIGLEPHSTVIANLGIASITVILLLVGAALLLTRPSPPEY